MRATAIAHPDIALVMHRGEANTAENLPAVGSISIRLDALLTTTTIDLDTLFKKDRLILDRQASATSGFAALAVTGTQ